MSLRQRKLTCIAGALGLVPALAHGVGPGPGELVGLRQGEGYLGLDLRDRAGVRAAQRAADQLVQVRDQQPQPGAHVQRAASEVR